MDSMIHIYYCRLSVQFWYATWEERYRVPSRRWTSKSQWFYAWSVVLTQNQRMCNSSYFPKYVGLCLDLPYRKNSWAAKPCQHQGQLGDPTTSSLSMPTKGQWKGKPRVQLHTWDLILWLKVSVPCFKYSHMCWHVLFSHSFVYHIIFWKGVLVVRGSLLLASHYFPSIPCSPWPLTHSRTYPTGLHCTEGSEMASTVTFLYSYNHSLIKVLSFTHQELLFLPLVESLVHLPPTFKTFSSIIEWVPLAIFHSEEYSKSGLPKCKENLKGKNHALHIFLYSQNPAI